MKKFVILTYGFEQPTKEIMNAWGAWFASIGDKMVDMGGPFGGGKEISRTGDRDLPLGKESLTGYVVINAESLSEAETVARNCPMIHSVQVYETMEMG
jgi:hypothetical protein